MALLRDILSPTVGTPQFAVASRRRRMTQPDFYDELMNDQQQQIGNPVENNLFAKQTQLADEPQTGNNFAASLQRLANRPAPPELQPSARIRQADMSQVQPDNFKSFYEMLGSITNRGEQMLGAAQAQAVHRRKLEQERLMQQQIAGFQLPNLQSGGGGSYGSPYGGKVSKGVQQWSGIALQVMKELGIPSQYLPDVLRRMNQESGGNPNAINNWDINAKRGTPSKGLMQTIEPTFNAYAGPYRGRGVYDPYANIYAGLNYAGHRYGPKHGGFVGGVLYAMGKPGGY